MNTRPLDPSSASFASRKVMNSEYLEGCQAAENVVALLRTTLDQGKRQELLAQALGDLIDANLGWNNLRDTQERLSGFSGVLAEQLSVTAGSPEVFVIGAPQRLSFLTQPRA